MFTLRWQRALEFFVVCVLAFLVLLPASPLVQKLPSWDSGVFLYTGWRITEGALPYRDVWDHKPPLIFVINALGLVLSGGSRWGVWLLEFVALTLALWLAFTLVRRAFGALTAVYAAIAAALNAFLAMDGGNYTTEYALPFQVAMLWLIATAPRDTFSTRRAFVLGILSALLFWLKQNDIGIPIALGAYFILQLIFSREKSAVVQNLAAMLGGALVVSVLVIFPFAFQNALAEFWDAAFAYNFAYIEETWLDRLLTLRFVPVFLPVLGLTLFATMGWLLGALLFFSMCARAMRLEDWQTQIELLRGRRENLPADALNAAQVSRMLAIALLALPCELLLVSISGNPFNHYFLALLPVFAILAAFFFSSLLTLLRQTGLSKRAVSLFALVLIVSMTLFGAEPIQGILQRIVERGNSSVINYLRENTSDGDTVFIWGGEARVLYEIKRRTPTRYLYPAPLVRRNFTTPQRAQEFLDVLLRQPPRWLIDDHLVRRPFFEFPFPSEKIRADTQSFLGMYQERAVVNGWTIYELRAK